MGGEDGLRLQRFDGAERFLLRAGRFLAEREAAHNLLLGLATSASRRQGPGDATDYAATVERHPDGAPVAAALRLGGGLILSQADDPTAVDLFAEDLARGTESLPGVQGPPPLARRFAARWRVLHGQQTDLTVALGIYEFTAEGLSLAAGEGVSGAMRWTAEGDRALLVDWVAAFYEGENLPGVGEVRSGAERSVAARLPRSDDAGLAVWCDPADRPVSVAGYSGPTPTGIRVGPVYTPPEFRRRGYASALTATLSRALLADGRRACFLFTDLANPTSNRIYQSIGYRFVTMTEEIGFAPPGAKADAPPPETGREGDG